MISNVYILSRCARLCSKIKTLTGGGDKHRSAVEVVAVAVEEGVREGVSIPQGPLSNDAAAAAAAVDGDGDGIGCGDGNDDDWRKRWPLQLSGWAVCLACPSVNGTCRADRKGRKSVAVAARAVTFSSDA